MSRPRRTAFGIALGVVATIGLPLGFWWLVHQLDATTLRVGIAPLADGEFIASADARPPAAAAGWERHAIPDDWRTSARTVVEGWYRFSFPADASDHVKHIYGKLEVRSRAEAVYEAMQLGLIDDKR